MGLIQKTTATAAATSVSATFTSNLTAGTKLVVWVHAYDNDGGAMATPTRNDGGAAFTAAAAMCRNAAGLDTNYVGQWFIADNANSGPCTITVAGANFWFLAISEWLVSQLDITSPTPTTGATNANPHVLTGPATTPVTNDSWILSGIGGEEQGGSGNPTDIIEPTQGGTWTSLGENLDNNATVWGAAAYVSWQTADGTVTPTWQVIQGTILYNYFVSNIVLREGAAPTYTQEGYRWRNDDGTELSATYAAAQDTTATIPPDSNRRLRVIVDTNVADAPATQFRLDYKTTAGSTWRPIGQGAAGSTPTHVETVGAAIGNIRSPSVTFTTSPVEGDVVYLFCASTTTATITVPSGWVNPLGGTTDVESDSHQACAVYHVVTAADDTANLVTFTATNLYDAARTGEVIGMIVRGANATTPVDATNSGFDSGNAVTPHVLAGISGANLESNSLVVSGVAKDGTGTYTQPSGWTLRASRNTNQGAALLTRDTATTAGSDVAATNITPSAGDEYASITVAFSAPLLAAPVNYALSPNIGDGAATSAQLTPPAGKSTSNFTAGVVTEGKALANSVDPANNAYTELEWTLVLPAAAVSAGQTYDLRVTRDGSPLDTYAVTPTLTVGSGGAIDLTVADAAHTHAADNVAPTQTHVLTVAAAAHGHSADNVTLLTGLSLLPANGIHGHIADNVPLVQNQNLVVANALHAHAADNAVTTAAQTLAVDAAVHAHVANNVTFVAASYAAAVSANGRYLVDHAGQPWFGVGDTAWSLAVQLTASEVTQYLTDRAARGVNYVLFNVIEHWYSSQTPAWRNVAGNLPFVGVAFQSALNEPYWQLVDHIVSESARLGITALICPAYLGINSNEGWSVEVAAATNAQMTAYGQSLAARYASYPNVNWLIGHDKVPTATEAQREAALAQALDAGTAHLITVGGIEQQGTAAWAGSGVPYNYNTTYFTDEQPALHVQAGWAVTPTLPTGFVEGVYEAERAYSNQYNDEPFIRSQLYGALCSGATYSLFGNNPIWHFEAGAFYPFTGSWETNLNSPGSQKLNVLAALLATLTGAWAAMLPDTTDTFLPATSEGTGTTRSSARFNATGTTGTLALVYRADGGTAAITLNLNRFTAVTQVRVRKFDPVAGTYTLLGVYPTTGAQGFSALGTNAAGDTDWLLILDVPPSLSLNVFNAAHSHVAGNVDPLLTETTLTVDAAVHGHTAASIAVGQVHVLTVANALHGHTPEAVTISVGGITIIATDTLHAHTASNVALTQLHSLLVANAIHGHTADNLILTGPYVFVVNGIERRRLYIIDEDRIEEVDPMHFSEGNNVAKRVTGDHGDTVLVYLDGDEDLAQADRFEAHVRRLSTGQTLAANLVDPTVRAVRVQLDPWLPTAAVGMWGLEVTVGWATTEITYPGADEDRAQIDVRAQYG